MNLQPAFPFIFTFLSQKTVVVDVSNEALSSDGGLIPICQFYEQIGFTSQISKALYDRRESILNAHSLVSMIRQRIFGILADYEDQNDHESLRHDPVFKMIAGRSPDDPKHLAGQFSLPRFENGFEAKVVFRLRDVLFDHFIATIQA